MDILNPYIGRKAVIDPDEFVGREGTVGQLMTGGVRAGQSYSIVGEANIGKSSLLYLLTHPDAVAERMPDPNAFKDLKDYLWVLVELQRLPHPNASSFWKLVLHCLEVGVARAGVRSEDFFSTPIENRSGSDDKQEVDFTQVEEFLVALQRRVILLFDDFEMLFTDFEGSETIVLTERLRALATASHLSNKLTYIVACSSSLLELSNESDLSIRPSPLVNIINEKKLDLWSKEEVLEYIKLRNSQVPEEYHFNHEEVEYVWQMTSGHPGLIQIVCYHLFDAVRTAADAGLQEWRVDLAQLRAIIERDSYVRWLCANLDGRAEKGVSSAAELKAKIGLFASTEPVFDASSATYAVKRRDVKTVHAKSKPDDLTSRPTEIELTRREGQLFNYLLAHAGRMCTREELREAIWNDSPPSSRDALDRLVKRLREKIEVDPQVPALLNVRGQGYLLRSEAADHLVSTIQLR